MQGREGVLGEREGTPISPNSAHPRLWKVGRRLSWRLPGACARRGGVLCLQAANVLVI